MDKTLNELTLFKFRDVQAKVQMAVLAGHELLVLLVELMFMGQ